MTTIPSPYDLGIVYKIDGDQFDKALAYVSDQLRHNITSPRHSTIIDIHDLQALTNDKPSDRTNKIMQLLASKLRESGWDVITHLTNGYIDVLFISPMVVKTILVRWNASKIID